ncbi:MAG: DUF1844 domain-containing protein, partial [candidate division Zixibacteria bacterium]|nr:DUF1844 domain-containing protein [candidate division Zixibacteria bacterium]
LGMVSEKTKGNLNDEEDKFLTNILHELRLNYTDEASQPDPQPEEESKDGEESKDDSEPEAAKSDNPESENRSDSKE